MSVSQHPLLIVADLHLDHWDATFESDNVLTDIMNERPEEFTAPELVISAGDLAHARPLGIGMALDQIKLSLPKGTPLAFTPGNHEYYLGELDDGFLQTQCEQRDVIFAQKKEMHLGATRILMCTLWTDGLLNGEDERPETVRIMQRGMADYRVIRKPGRPENITALDTITLHEEHLAWIKSHLDVKHDGPTLIVTHHGPHPEASLPIDGLTAGFMSDLSEMIEEYQPDAWVFGHTHRPQSVVLGKTRIHNVGLGYPREVAPYGIRNMLLRGCLIVGDEVRFMMDDFDDSPIRRVNGKGRGFEI